MIQGDKDDHQNVHHQSHLGRHIYTFHVQDVGTGQSAVTFDDVLPGFTHVVEEVQGHAESSAANADVDIHQGGASITDTLTAEPSGHFSVDLNDAKADRRGSDTDHIELVITTDGTGTITGLTVQVVVRPAPMGGEIGQ